MRHCKYWRCRRPFLPDKPYFYYCSWDCRAADVGADYQRDYRGYQRGRDTQYDRGWHDAWQAKAPRAETIPPHIWRALAMLVHPDRWQREPALLSLSNEVMIWLNAHRPTDTDRN